MDDIVRQAMAKWPNVPDCFGWLGLDARGDWYMRDERAQAAGAFTSGEYGAKGSRLQHVALIEFICRNYAVDPQGRAYFQNGPQRVFVELEVTPWVWRIEPDGSVKAHTGHAVEVRRCIVDETGRVYLDTSLGFGLVHSQDVVRAAEMVETGCWVPEYEPRDEMPRRYGFLRSPQRDTPESERRT